MFFRLALYGIAFEEAAGALVGGVIDHVGGAAILHDDALVHEQHVVGHLTGELHLVRDDDHGGVARGERANDVEHLAGQLGIERAGRLVEAEDVRIERQRPRNGDALLLAAGELMRIVVHARFQPDALEQRAAVLVDFVEDGLFARFVVGALFGEDFSGQHDVLERRVLREEIEGLDIKIFRFEKMDCCYEDLSDQEKAEENRNILNGLNFARKVIATQECDFLLLDEILGLLDNGIATEEAIEDILKLKDESMHIVMTGRELPDGLKAHVDTVTTLTTEEVHPIQDEIKSHTDTEE